MNHRGLWITFTVLVYLSYFFTLGVRVIESVQRPGYGLGDRGSIPGRVKDPSPSLGHCVQADSLASPPSKQMVTGRSYTIGKTVGA